MANITAKLLRDRTQDSFFSISAWGLYPFFIYVKAIYIAGRRHRALTTYDARAQGFSLCSAQAAVSDTISEVNSVSRALSFTLSRWNVILYGMAHIRRIFTSLPYLKLASISYTKDLKWGEILLSQDIIRLTRLAIWRSFRCILNEMEQVRAIACIYRLL